MAAGTNPQHVSKVTVLMYHNFITEADEQKGVEFEEYSLRPADFEADLQYFRENGYTTITSADLLDYINGKKPLPAKALILSIDDGTLGVYTNGWPLLKKYRMKADFNLIGENIDAAWETVHAGQSRDGESAPYCEWNELITMAKSGEINLCSHTYGLHHYNREGRIGTSLMEGETIEHFASTVTRDYKLCVSCITGWTDLPVNTMAYPYSRRSEESDKAILENTGYQILMAGEGARETAANYFVDGASAESYQRVMNRPCRMEGHPASEYLEDVDQRDEANGVNAAEDTMKLTPAECARIAACYSPYEDVAGSASYAGAVYFTYVNGLLPGTSLTRFSPDAKVSPAEAAALLKDMDGITLPTKTVTRAELAIMIQAWANGGQAFVDINDTAYYADAVKWAVDQNITGGTSSVTFSPGASCTRGQIVTFLWKAAGSPKATGENPFTDVAENAYYYDAVLWAVNNHITSGTGTDTFSPNGVVTRAQTVTFLWRAAGSPAAVQRSAFRDVPADAYYAGAVDWAVQEGITSGTGGNAFSPKASCTRGQIVTFLHNWMAK